MNAISTLCATTTVGAAALGYAFAVPHNPTDPRSPTSTSSRTNNSWKPLRRWSTSRSQGSLMSLPTSSLHLLSGRQSDAKAQGTSREESLFQSDTAQSLGPSRRHETTPINQPLSTRSPPHDDPKPIAVSRQRTRPASWAVSHTSTSRTSPNPRAASDTIPENFSSSTNLDFHTIGENIPTQQKRASSGNLLGLKQTWRRSDAGQQQAVTLHIPSRDVDEVVYDTDTKNLASKSYKNYFIVTLEQESGSPIHPQTRPLGNVRRIRRIRPSGRQLPTLTMAHSVAAPVTASETFGPWNGAINSESSDHSPASVSSPQFSSSDYGDIHAESESRRSFSISDLLSRKMSFRRNVDDSQRPRHRFQRPLSQRITSAPQFGAQENRARGSGYELSGRLSEGFDNRRAVSGPAMRSFIDGETGPGSSFGAKRGDDVAPSPIQSSTSTNCRESPKQLQSPNLSSSLEPVHFGSQRSQQSTTLSELSSSHLGSDINGRVFSSCGEDETDIRSETVYDSTRTDTKPGRVAFRGSLFEDDSSGYASHDQKSSFDGFLLGKPSTSTRDYTHVIDEEEEGFFPTPVREADCVMESRGSPVHRSANHLDSSPPGGTETSTLRNVSLAAADESDPFGWSDDEELNPCNGDETLPEVKSPSPDDILELRESSPSAMSADPAVSYQSLGTEPEPKLSVFDWSEQPIVERVSSNGAPRPKTMHGKNSRDTRGGRSNGRRAPSGPHARSQSVPALSDQTENRVGGTSKFGTWGIGSKGATEDWDDDFDFSGPPAASLVGSGASQQGAIAAEFIFIPQAIREQQTNVLANIGLLKEWGILIEELKELRLRATMLRIDAQQFQSTLDEVDAMIDLADQEADESIEQDPIPFPSPMPEPSREEQEPAPAEPIVSDRTSQLLMESTTRPRTNSEAIARSVIQAIQQQRTSGAKTPQQSPVKARPKVPFDKGTLKHILPHLVNLVKTMKKILRNAEGFSASPEQKSKQRAVPAFSKAFVVPADDSPTKAGRHGLRLDFGLVEEDWDLS